MGMRTVAMTAVSMDADERNAALGATIVTPTRVAPTTPMPSGRGDSGFAIPWESKVQKS